MRYKAGLIVTVMLVALGAQAEGGTITISNATCAQLVAHQPSADVAYQPGVDAYGMPVVPAEGTDATTLATPDSITIDLQFDLARFGLPNNSVLKTSDVNVGKVEYNINTGAVTYNGQPITTAEQQALGQLCQEKKAAAKKTKP